MKAPTGRALAKANDGSAGVDGVTFEQVESEALDEWLSGIREELRVKAYSPRPVLRVMIPKPGGGRRPLGISLRNTVLKWKVTAMSHRPSPSSRTTPIPSGIKGHVPGVRLQSIAA